ncbi:hypothetical protein RvY_11588 [Ramazzottius varieornatus]|uniref:Uncharacterized protein n=1 Tax=Ramazzottius varieornatus TaxID=947166 RepID=A0A1D1VM05_RAMVA|nr:hypothetical protein RvY_11588 [Ramazzottius varieornatus]
MAASGCITTNYHTSCWRQNIQSSTDRRKVKIGFPRECKLRDGLYVKESKRLIHSLGYAEYVGTTMYYIRSYGRSQPGYATLSSAILLAWFVGVTLVIPKLSEVLQLQC